MCGQEAQKAAEIATLPIHVKQGIIHNYYTSLRTCQLFILCLRIGTVNVDTSTKLLLKFDGLETVCEERRPKKLHKWPH